MSAALSILILEILDSEILLSVTCTRLEIYAYSELIVSCSRASTVIAPARDRKATSRSAE
ncbi:MAG: hypothetical protein DMF68_21365 [Acidobacteria bacterium]|nr:MAG: hypothetical protein DMF68_21365 [Acidobacteriota bacterium]